MISIVLPVFNGEKTIEQALECLGNQTFKNLEIIIVNDGSTDNTQEIVEKFTNRDPRFILINKENEGVASARNKGVEVASGEYIIHHDADDSRPTDSLEKLYKKAQEIDADIVMGDYAVINGDKSQRINQKFDGDSEDLIQGLLDGKYHAGLWNKLIKSDLSKSIAFEEGINYMEDKLLLIRMLLHRPKIAYQEVIAYHYVQTPDSITNKLSVNSLVSMKKVIKRIENEFSERKLKYDLTKPKLSYKLAAILNDITIDHKSEFSEVNPSILTLENYPLRYKLLLFFEVKGISVFSKIYNKIK